MQRKLAFLVCAIMALISFDQAVAQSSHDAVVGPDPDLKEPGSGEFEVKSPNGKYKLGFRGHLQENNRFNYDMTDKSPKIKLELKRARFSVYGNAFDPRLTYLFQMGFETKDSYGRKLGILGDDNNYPAPGTDFLRDYYLNYACHDEYFQVRIGKFRSPFSRQQLMSTSQMQFWNQSKASDDFQITDSGRDIGIMFHNGFNNPFEWALAAVTNGVVARIGFNHNHIDGYDFVDWTGSDFRAAVAANGFLHTDYTSLKLDDIRAGIDFVAKAGGFSTNGEGYYQRLKKEDEEAVHQWGAGADIGYLIKDQYEPVLRYSWVKDPQQSHDGVLGFNNYIYGHHLKVQTYAGARTSDPLKLENYKFIGGVMFQLAI